MSVAAIIWDWNGTLLDDVDYALGCMNRMLARRALPLLSTDRYRAVFGFPVERYYEQLGFDFAIEPFQALSAEFIANYYGALGEPPLHAGARDLLAQLDQAGLYQVVLSAMEQGPLVRQIECHSLGHVFRIIQGLSHIHADSKLVAGQELLAAIPYPKEEILLVGDTRHDAEVADTLGIGGILVSHGHQSATQWDGKMVETVANLDDLRIKLEQGRDRPDRHDGE